LPGNKVFVKYQAQEGG